MVALLRKNKSFNALFWTQLTGALNDNVFKNALVIMITYKEATVIGLPPAQIVALAGGLFIFPFFLFSAWAGQLAEKHSRVQIARVVKWAELGIMAICAAGFFFNHFMFLLFGLFLMGVHSTFFGPIKYSLVPTLLQPSELNSGNGYIEAGTFFAILTGTIMGGWAAAQSEGIIVCTLIGVSLVGLTTSYLLPPTEPTSPQLKIETNWLSANFNLLTVIKSVPGSWQKILGLSWFWFLGAAVMALLPPYTKDFVLGDENIVTLFLATFTIGIAIGAAAAAPLLKKLSSDRVVRIGGLLMSLALIDWAFLKLGPVPFIQIQLDIQGQVSGMTVTTIQNYFSRTNSIHILVDLLLLAAGGGLFTVPQMTALQTDTPKDEISRMIAANNILNSVFIVASAVFLMAMYALKFNFSQILLSVAVLNTLLVLNSRK